MAINFGKVVPAIFLKINNVQFIQIDLKIRAKNFSAGIWR